MKKKIVLIIIFSICIILLIKILKINNSYLATMSILGYKENTIHVSGTGFVYKLDSDSAYVLTNYHVIENSDYINIKNVKNKTCEADILGYDNYFDLAVLKIDKKCALSKLEISNSNIGSYALIIPSNKSENYKQKILFSKITDRDKIISIEDNLNKSIKVIELNTEFDYGNSGSPVIDINGNLIGVLTLKSIENKNGYAIGVDDISYIVNFIEKNGIVKRKNLGILVSSVTNYDIINSYGIKQPNLKNGVIVLDVKEDSTPLNKGDIIVKINDQKIESAKEYQYYISKFILQKEMTIEYYRNNKLNKIKL